MDKSADADTDAGPQDVIHGQSSHATTTTTTAVTTGSDDDDLEATTNTPEQPSAIMTSETAASDGETAAIVNNDMAAQVHPEGDAILHQPTSPKQVDTSDEPSDGNTTAVNGAESISPAVGVQEASMQQAAMPAQQDSIQDTYQPQDHVATSSTTTSTEQEWPLKLIHWPPFTEYPRQVKILMQDLNGPCSFIALCNVLLVSLFLVPRTIPCTTVRYIN